jgi:hypothetical protein
MSTKPPAAERCYKLVTHNGTPHWECRFCSVFNSGKRGIRRFDVEKVKKSSGNLWRHIEKQHPQHYVAPPSRTSDVSTLETCSDITSIASSPVAAAAAGSKRAASPSGDSVASKRSKQTTLFASKVATSSIAQQAAIAFAVNHLSFLVADSSAFRAMLDLMRGQALFPSRRAIQSSTLAVATDLRRALLQRLRDTKAPVGIAFDGWTNVRGAKVTNIVLISAGAAYYWHSIVNSQEKNTAKWLQGKLRPVLNELHAEGVEFAGFIGDNEAVNGALFKRLLVDFPLVRVPCAAHTIQLVVKDVLAYPRWAAVKQNAEGIIRGFAASKEDRQKLESHQKVDGVEKPKVIIKSVETRWNSFLAACIRMLQLKKWVQSCFEQTEEFWKELQLLIAFLKPFQVATDVVQRDASTLFDVFQQWNMLNAHLLGAEDSSMKNHALDALRDRWHANVNMEATNATAIFSFVNLQAASDEIESAKRFVARFGSRYLRFFGKSQKPATELEAELLIQFGRFSMRAAPFASIDADLRAAKLNPRGWNPLDVWGIHFEKELAKVAVVLLSIPSSEAAVERTFSAQDDIHRKKRNRLKDETVQASMFIAFNHRRLSQTLDAAPAVREVELSLDFMDTDTEEEESDDDESDASSNGSEEEQASPSTDDEMQVDEEPAAPIRQETQVFLKEFIAQNNIHSKTRFSAELIGKLDEEARQKNEGGATTETLIQQIRKLAPPPAPPLLSLPAI